MQKKSLLFALMAVFVLSACNKDDDEPTPTESANFTVTVENILPVTNYSSSGSLGFLAPGEQQTVEFHAGDGDYLSFATMFVQSNDLFYGFEDRGLRLHDADGNPITGDVTSKVDLWDAGTEVNQEPGVGADQAPRQTGPNAGTTENGVVRLVSELGDGFVYPADEQVIRLTLKHDGGTLFTFTIENISAGSSLPSPLAPGGWAIHKSGVRLFTDGEASSAGLEAVAEDGNNEEFINDLTAWTGYTSPYAPGVWAVHAAGSTPIFADGATDSGEGLEELAEDGDPSILAASLTNGTKASLSGVFNTPDGASGPGPILPGGSYSFTFKASEGDYFNLATMLVETNDLFLAFDEGGIALFNNGIALSGDITNLIELWDAGTEVNEYPGAGKYQPIRGGGNSGPAEGGSVVIVNDGFTYPAVNELIKITIQAN